MPPAKRTTSVKMFLPLCCDTNKYKFFQARNFYFMRKRYTSTKEVYISSLKNIHLSRNIILARIIEFVKTFI